MGNLFKSLPSEYLYVGYNVRKGLSVTSKVKEGKVYYDIFLYTYLDDKLSLYYLMDDGNYKNPDINKNVNPINIEDMMSKYLYEGTNYDLDDYGEYNKDDIIGVFGLRKINELLLQIDELESKMGINKMKIQAIYDSKKSYSGLEINNIIDRWNKDFSTKGTFVIPAIVNDMNDNSYASPIGDELEFFDGVSNKNSDEIVAWLREKASMVDGVGNIRK